jgi:hypothetical protein
MQGKSFHTAVKLDPFRRMMAHWRNMVSLLTNSAPMVWICSPTEICALPNTGFGPARESLRPLQGSSGCTQKLASGSMELSLPFLLCSPNWQTPHFTCKMTKKRSKSRFISGLSAAKRYFPSLRDIIALSTITSRHFQNIVNRALFSPILSPNWILPIIS